MYEQCCLRWHSGDPAPTAQALMRSRYSAFVLCNEPYLLATWHESKRPSTVEFEPNQKWLGLTIVDSDAADPITAEVEFIARYRIGGGSAARLHERSRFIKEGDRWYYVDGKLK
jgi:SEC-C motif-containing protein